MYRINKCTGCLIAVPLLSACDAPAPTPQAVAESDGQGQLTRSHLDGSSVPLAPHEIVYHGGDIGGVTQLELSVNRQVVASDVDFGSSQIFVTMHYMWTPPSPGNYTLRARTQNRRGDWREYANANQITEDDDEKLA